MNKRLLTIGIVTLICAIAFAQQNNPKAFLKEKRQEKTLASLQSVDGTRLYALDYRADYRLQDVIDSSLVSQNELVQKGMALLLDTDKLALAKGFMDKPACAAFCAKTPEGDMLFCRNFDYSFKDGANILMRTSPRRGYRSISMVAASFLGMKGTQLCDGKTDLSGLVCAPYAQMDGMNEKGLCISVLQLKGESAAQYSAGKPSVMTSVMMRMVLDRAANVDEAIQLINGINFYTNKDLIGSESPCNYHFLLSDAKGKSVVLEYIRRDGPNTDSPWIANFMDGHALTNHYLSSGWEAVSHREGDKRLDVINETLSATQGTLSETDAMALLEKVSQENSTQWSIVYNITMGTARVCMLRDYSKTTSFKIRGKKKGFTSL